MSVSNLRIDILFDIYRPGKCISIGGIADFSRNDGCVPWLIHVSRVSQGGLAVEPI